MALSSGTDNKPTRKPAHYGGTSKDKAQVLIYDANGKFVSRVAANRKNIANMLAGLLGLDRANSLSPLPVNAETGRTRRYVDFKSVESRQDAEVIAAIEILKGEGFDVSALEATAEAEATADATV